MYNHKQNTIKGVLTKLKSGSIHIMKLIKKKTNLACASCIFVWTYRTAAKYVYGLCLIDLFYNVGWLSSPCRTVYPKKYAHGFVVLCFVVVMHSFIMRSHEVFIHIHQGCFAGTGAIVRLPQCQWSKPDGYGKSSRCITTTNHSKAKTVCIFLGIYCTCLLHKCLLSLKLYEFIRYKKTFLKVQVKSREPRLYISGVTAGRLQRHLLSKITVIFNKFLVF